MSRNFRSDLKQSKYAQTVVARQGISAWLLFLSALLMSFLSIYTLTLSGIAGKLASEWDKTLTESATLRISIGASTPENASAIAGNILKTTPGILSFTELSNERELALLEPWLGSDIPSELLSLPQIFTTKIDVAVLDEQSLVGRLNAELPSATWDNHQRWRGPLLDSAKRLHYLSWVSTAIITFAFIFLIFICAEASIYSNAKSITLLRQIGAEDAWITNGFLRKFVLRTVAGSAFGVSLGLFATYGLLNAQTQGNNIFQAVDMLSFQWPRAFLVIICAAIIGFLCTKYAAFRYLKKVV